MAHRDDEDGVESVSAALGWEDTGRGDVRRGEWRIFLVESYWMFVLEECLYRRRRLTREA